MWSLLSPLFLWGMLAASVPLALHFLRRQRSVDIPFSTVRFLKVAREHSSRRVMFENALLWLLRTLVVILAVLAFAGPVLRLGGLRGLRGRVPRNVVVVVDASASMGYALPNRTVWERSVRIVDSILRGLRPGDAACLFLADRDVHALVEKPTPDLALIRSLLEEQAPSHGSSQLLPAIRAGCSVLEQAGRRERELHIVTDGQGLPWRDVLQAEDIAERLDEARCNVLVADMGLSETDNAGVRAVSVAPELILPRCSATIRAEITVRGAVPVPAVSLTIDGEEAGRVQAAEQGVQTVQFMTPPLYEGVHAARVAVSPDAYAQDDEFHFLVHCRPGIKVLCVGSEQETFFLSCALNPDGRGPLTVDKVEPDAFASVDVAQYACIFLCDAIGMDGNAIVDAEAHVRSGATLVIFPGDASSLDAYARWSCLPARPLGFHSGPGLNGVRTPLQFETVPDSVLAGIEVPPRSTPTVALRRFLSWEEPPEATRVLMRAGTRPMLCEAPFGDGRVLMFAVAAGRSWSDFPLSPLYLPTVHCIAMSAAGTSAWRPWVRLADRVRVRPGTVEVQGPMKITGPNGERVSYLAAGPGSDALVVQNVFRPGIYHAAHDGGRQIPLLAANAPREESDLERADRQAVVDRSGAGRVSWVRSETELAGAIDELRNGRPLSEAVLWLLAALAFVELAVANRSSQAPGSLVTALNVDGAGRVRGSPGK